MARQTVKMPDIGEGTTEAEIVAWLVKPGDHVDEDDPLAEVMTDKATVEIPAPTAGTIVSIAGKVGEKRPVGSELLVLETDREPAAPSRASHHAAVAAIARTTPLTPRPPPQPNPLPASGARERDNAAETPRPVYGEREGEGREKLTEAPAPNPLSRHAGEGGDARSAATGEGAVAAQSFNGKPLAAPAVRKRAWDMGIALQFVAGTGPGGRITHQDLDAFDRSGPQPPRAVAVAAPAAPPPAVPPPPPAAAPPPPEPRPGPTAAPSRTEGIEDIPVTGLRRIIAERLQQSKRQIPHYSYIEEIDVTALEELRAQLNTLHERRGHLTVLPFLMRAIVNAVVEHPQVNARFDDAAGIVHRYRAAHVGVATQTDAGLMVPVVRDAGTLDLWQAAAEIARLAAAARAAKATRDELSGSTITITSLGRLGGLAATPVINYPEVAIVGVNRIDERPVVRAGAVVIRKMMNLSSSFDHRIVDGWEAASFIQRVKDYLEHPVTLFIG